MSKDSRMIFLETNFTSELNIFLAFIWWDFLWNQMIVTGLMIWMKTENSSLDLTLIYKLCLLGIDVGLTCIFFPCKNRLKK